jgi:hypothetical protein
MLHKTSLARASPISSFSVLFDRMEGFSEQIAPRGSVAIRESACAKAPKPEEVTRKYGPLSYKWQANAGRPGS